MTKPETNEELAEAVQRALLAEEPCWCGDVLNESPCPACTVGTGGQEAFKELLRRFNVEA